MCEAADCSLDIVRFISIYENGTVLDDFILCSNKCQSIHCNIGQLMLQEKISEPFRTLLIPCNNISGYTEISCIDLLKDTNSKRLKLDGKGNGFTVVKVDFKIPSYHIIDLKWSRMLNDSCQERRELEMAMSWLSTLGGAFSSLGDNFEYCAITAGKISAHQFNLAMKLGDPFTVVRCKLYLSISLIQRKKFRWASRIIKSQYSFVKTVKEVDRRLISMCLGIWTKLKYEKSLYKSQGIS